MVLIALACSTDHRAPLGDISLASADRAIEGTTLDDEGSNLGYYGMAAGDLDGDGQVDVAATDFASGARATGGRSADGFGVSVAIVDVMDGGADEWIIARRIGGTGDCYYSGTLSPQPALEVYRATGGAPDLLATLSVSGATCGTVDPQLSRLGDTDGDGAAELGVRLSGADSRVAIVPVVEGDAEVEDIATVILTDPLPEGDFGERLASGDLDGDGLWEIIASAEPASAGYSAAVLSPPFVGQILAEVSVATVVGLPAMAVGSGGDLDGDGLHDWVGASGDLWVWSGAAAAGEVDAEAAFAVLLAHPFPSAIGGELSMYGAAVAKDLDGDGVDDLVGGAPADVGADGGGVVAVWYGPVAGTRAFLEADARLVGENPGDAAGQHVLGPGDVDGDGYGDIVVSAPEWDGERGAIYVADGGER